MNKPFSIVFLADEWVAVYRIVTFHSAQFYEFEKICPVNEFLEDLKAECIIESELLRDDHPANAETEREMIRRARGFRFG